MIVFLLSYFQLLPLLMASWPFSSDGFREVKRDELPRAAIRAICKDLEGHPCWNEFLKEGKAYSVDVNDDGRMEFLVHIGFQDSGSGGDWYTLIQEKQGVWKEIPENGGWQLYHQPRLKKLEKVRLGYHDLRLGRTLFVKWNGAKYVPYAENDYKNLSTSIFDANDPEDTEILWVIRYLGSKDFTLEPQWISPLPEFHSLFGTITDPVQKSLWISEYKGGVWAQNENRAFLLLPRSSYLGSTDMKMDGEWLIIFGDGCDPSHVDQVEIARYNLRSHQLKLPACLQIPYPAN